MLGEMKLQDDIKSPAVLRSKGWLFLLLGVAASVLLLADGFSWQRLGLLLIALWGFCRFYYFLFHVLEHYAGRDRPYAGLFDAMKWALSGRETKSGD
jgi:hypothetical protein